MIYTAKQNILFNHKSLPFVWWIHPLEILPFKTFLMNFKLIRNRTIYSRLKELVLKYQSTVIRQNGIHLFGGLGFHPKYSFLNLFYFNSEQIQKKKNSKELFVFYGISLRCIKLKYVLMLISWFMAFKKNFTTLERLSRIHFSLKQWSCKIFLNGFILSYTGEKSFDLSKIRRSYNFFRWH